MDQAKFIIMGAVFGIPIIIFALLIVLLIVGGIQWIFS